MCNLGRRVFADKLNDEVRLVDAVALWLAGFCATARNSDRVGEYFGEGIQVCRGLKRVTLTYPMK